MDTQQVSQKILDHIAVVVKSAVKEAAGQLMQQKQVNFSDTDDDYLSAEQAAQFLKIKLNTVYSKVEKGELPHYRSGKRKLLFSKKELADYIVGRKGKTKADISDEADNYLLKK